MWTSTDPKGQFFNPYRYCANNPILLTDPNGEYILGAIIGAVVGAYVGGAMANGSLNPGDWNWNNAGTYMGIIGGGIGGASLGSGVENTLVRNYYSQLSSPMPTGYWQDAYISARGGLLSIENSNIETAYRLGGEEPVQSEVNTLKDVYNLHAGTYTYHTLPPEEVDILGHTVNPPASARGVTVSSEQSFISKNAFEINGNFEPRSIVETMLHESDQQLTFPSNFSDLVGEAGATREYALYQYEIGIAQNYNLSSGVINYMTNNMNAFGAIIGR